MLHLDMQVRSIIPDSTASTARQTLHRMGLSTVADVHRLQRWRFDVDDQDDWSQVANQLSRVDILANANKHRAVVARVDGPNGEAVPPAGPRPRQGTSPVWICIESLDDTRARSVRDVLRNRLGLSFVHECASSELWRLDVETTSRETARDTARSAMDKLLVNAQFQKGRLLDD